MINCCVLHIITVTELAEPRLPKGNMRNMASILFFVHNRRFVMTDENTSAKFELKRGQTKPFLTIEEQLDLLVDRGLIVNDRENALNILNRTNYYRLSAYSLTLRKDDIFYDGVTFDNIYELYRFDDAFRKIVFKHTQYTEISLRSYIAYEHSNKYGPQGYMENKHFDNKFYHLDFIAKLQEEIAKSDDVFVHHYKVDFDSVFPIWVAVECATFGNLSKLYKNLLPDDRTLISKKYYGVNREYIENWLQAAVFVRNVAAHGGRFYNRKLRTIPVKLPSKYKDTINQYGAFAYIYAIYKLQPTKALCESMRNDLKATFEMYPFALKKHLGFPDNWLEILIESENKKAY